MKIIVENAKQAKELTRRNGDAELRDLQEFLDLCLSEVTKEAIRGNDTVYLNSFDIEDEYIKEGISELEELGFRISTDEYYLEISW